MPDAGVEDDDREVGRQRHEAMLLGSAVEQERVTGPCEERRCRVHQADGHADRTMLRLLRDVRELESRQLELGRAAEREGQGHRQRRRRRQPGADRNGGGDRPVEPRGRPAALVQHAGDGARVADPAPESRPRRSVGRELDGLGELVRPEPDDGRIRPPAHRHAALERDRQDKPAGVIGVLPDEVDATGREGSRHVIGYLRNLSTLGIYAN